ncbi:MAG: DUF881 domain-containing protein [Firmicutes bacterium]|nr:DUF881 domain-containing protein [Bacillota bacterium]
MAGGEKQKKDIVFRLLFLSLFGILFLSGIGLHHRSGKEANKDGAELAAYLENAEAEAAALQQEIRNIQEELALIRSQEAEGQSLLSALTATLENLHLSAGLRSLQGPGIIIRLADNSEGAAQAQKANPTGYNPASYIVHDKDLLYLIRALAPEAEAISINEQRVIDSTAIRCLGSVILVNSTRLAPPYEIKAIGDPEALQAALNHSDRYRSLLRTYIPVEVDPAERIEIAAYGGSYAVSFSTAAKND